MLDVLGLPHNAMHSPSYFIGVSLGLAQARPNKITRSVVTYTSGRCVCVDYEW